MSKHALQLAILASAPAALAGTWNLGAQIVRAQSDPAASWQLEVLASVGVDLDAAGFFRETLIGAAFLLPLLAVAAASSRAWAEVFARARRRPLDPGWWHSAWLFVLLVPATTPLSYAALALSFGVLFGSHAFGGAGRYIVSPPLLAALFMAVAYPDLVGADRYLPGAGVPTTWSVVASGDVAAAAAAGVEWWPLFVGREIGAIGATSALACLGGALFLAARGAADWRIVAGGLLGVAAASALGGTLPSWWHVAIGSFAFALAFVATDPSVRPSTAAGAWCFGVLFGALTVLLRVANPEHPEGTLAALLLAMLCIPLLDEIVHAAALKQRGTAGAGG